MMTHILTCLWVLIAAFSGDEDYKGSWLESYYDQDVDLYMLSFYWAATTITTVGYGDISGTNDIERCFCTIVEIIGVIGFAFASSSLTSIITNIDQTNSEQHQKITIINRIRQEHKIPFRLYNNLKKNVEPGDHKVSDEINTFIDTLPHKLKMETALYIYEGHFKTMRFMKGIEYPSFLSWLCPLLKSKFLQKG